MYVGCNSKSNSS